MASAFLLPTPVERAERHTELRGPCAALSPLALEGPFHHRPPSMEHRPPSTAAGSSGGSRSSRPASIVPSTTRWKAGASSFAQPPAYSVSPPRVVKPWQPPQILREAENRTAEVIARHRPSSSSAFVHQVLSSRAQNAKLLEQASLAATAPLPAFQPPSTPLKGWRENAVAPDVADGIAADGEAAGTPSVPALRASLSAWTKWLDEEEELLDAAEHRQRPLLPPALRHGAGASLPAQAGKVST